MNKIKLGLVVLALATALLNRVDFANAEDSNFTSCLTPSGTVIAQYSDGNHGIAGLGSKIGQDKVHLLDNGNALQCFCGSDGAGIQTNWMKISDISQNQISVYESQGWIFIPDGSAWGLSDGAYLAKNIDYSCGSSISTTSGGDGRTDGMSDGLGSIVQSSRGSASNLATTGNVIFILEVFATGLILTLLGLFLRKRVN